MKRKQKTYDELLREFRYLRRKAGEDVMISILEGDDRYTPDCEISYEDLEYYVRVLRHIA